MLITTNSHVPVDLGGVKKRTRDGKEWWVAPMTILQTGVYQGSQGPIMYTEAENKRTHKAWNEMPIVVNHPQDPTTGDFISASTAGVVEERGVGMVLNSKAPKGRVGSEAWFDPDLTKVVEPRLHAALEAALNGAPLAPINVSTGLKLDPVPQSGNYQGLVYNSVATNYRPDHVAVLMDKPGACSIAHGCGLFVNEAPEDEPEEPGVAMQSDPAMVANEASFDATQQAIGDALDAANPAIRDMGYIEAVFSDRFIYRSAKKFWEQRYTMVGTLAKLVGTAAEVIRDVQYLPAPAPLTANTNGAEEMTKAILIANILAAGAFTEADKPALEAMDEALLTKIAPKQPAAPANVTANAGTCGCKGTPAPTPAPAAAAAPVVVNGDWRTIVPADVLAVLDDAVVTTNGVREQLVANVMGNAANKFSQAELVAMPTSTLRNIAAMVAPTPAPAVVANNGFGLFDFRLANAPVVANAGTPGAAAPAKMTPLKLPSSI